MASSEAPPSCLSNSNASNTLGETGGRPRLECVGKRWVKLRSIAATRAAQGKVSAHWQMGCMTGTKSATWRRVPCPVNQCWRWRKRRIVGSPHDWGGGASGYEDMLLVAIPSQERGIN